MDLAEKLLMPYASQVREEVVEISGLTDGPRDDREACHSSGNMGYIIRDSLCAPDAALGDPEILAPREVKALPGYERHGSCSLCKIRYQDDVMGRRVTETGCTLAELLRQAHQEFARHDGRPMSDVSEEVTDRIKLFAGQHPPSEMETLLANLSPEEVMQHFRYDHSRQNPVKVKQKTMRMLVNMLEVGVSTCCEAMGNGDVALGREGSTLVLQIVDRIHKMASLKEDAIP